MSETDALEARLEALTDEDLARGLALFRAKLGEAEAAYLQTCVHCGLCAESCHYYRTDHELGVDSRPQARAGRRRLPRALHDRRPPGPGPGRRAPLRPRHGPRLGRGGLRPLLALRPLQPQLHHRHPHRGRPAGGPRHADRDGPDPGRPAAGRHDQPRDRQQHGDHEARTGSRPCSGSRKRCKPAVGDPDRPHPRRQAGRERPVHGQPARAEVLPAVPAGQRHGLPRRRGGLDRRQRGLGPDELRPVQREHRRTAAPSPPTCWRSMERLGCRTLVIGECGHGFAAARWEAAEWLRKRPGLPDRELPGADGGVLPAGTPAGRSGAGHRSGSRCTIPATPCATAASSSPSAPSCGAAWPTSSR